MVVLLLTIVRGLVYSGCPRSCLMAHSDRGHPSVSSSGPAVLIAIKKKRQEGCLRRAFPEAPPPLKRMKKNQKEEEGNDTNSNVSAGPPDPRPPDDRIGPPTLFHLKLRQKMPWIQLLIPRLRLQDRMPLDVRAWFPWWRRDCCSVPHRSRIPTAEQDFLLDFLQDPLRGIQDIPQIYTARIWER